MKPAGDLASFIAGVVVGEGTFTSSGRKFVFAVRLGETDAGTCELCMQFFGSGSMHHSFPRRIGYDGEVGFAVQALPQLVDVVVPFMDEHLPPSYKRQQYEAWRAKLLDYWNTQARRRRPCTVEGCDAPQRAKGLCRRHYYARYGQ